MNRRATIGVSAGNGDPTGSSERSVLDVAYAHAARVADLGLAGHGSCAPCLACGERARTPRAISPMRCISSARCTGAIPGSSNSRFATAPPGTARDWLVDGVGRRSSASGSISSAWPPRSVRCRRPPVRPKPKACSAGQRHAHRNAWLCPSGAVVRDRGDGTALVNDWAGGARRPRPRCGRAPGVDVPAFARCPMMPPWPRS